MRRVRAVAHVHSDWSYDGSWSLQDLGRAFRARGCAAVLMTEHDRGFDQSRWDAYRDACARASGGGVLLVPGIEYSDHDNTVHVAVWGELPFLGEGRDTGELLAEVGRRGGVAVLAHPSRREAWRRSQPAWAPLLLGVELWNRKYDGWAPSAAAIELLRANPLLVPFVGPDFHTRRQFFPLAMALEVDAPITTASVVAALHARRCEARAFRLPARWAARGPALALARATERARRPAARRLRRLATRGSALRGRR